MDPDIFVNCFHIIVIIDIRKSAAYTKLIGIKWSFQNPSLACFPIHMT